MSPYTYEIVFWNRDSFELSGPTLDDILRQARTKRTKQRLDRVSRGVTELSNWYLIMSVKLVEYRASEKGVIRETAD